MLVTILLVISNLPASPVGNITSILNILVLILLMIPKLPSWEELRFGLRGVAILVASSCDLGCKELRFGLRRVASFRGCELRIVMAERSRSNDDHDAIQSVQAIPSSSPTESVDVCSLPTVAQAIDVPAGSPQADSTHAVPKPARGSQLRKDTTPILSNLSPPTTRARAIEKRSNNPSLESVKEIQVT
ncbi:hypothetical protein R1sor_024553 [Riccia sorocarpa]|uniref:Uncharacterized protein n=1 Tax=Riccia sorocarpa TaxID=122646 RepID=A0ABD3GT29_9MARC